MDKFLLSVSFEFVVIIYLLQIHKKILILYLLQEDPFVPLSLNKKPIFGCLKLKVKQISLFFNRV